MHKYSAIPAQAIASFQGLEGHFSPEFAKRFLPFLMQLAHIGSTMPECQPGRAIVILDEPRSPHDRTPRLAHQPNILEHLTRELRAMSQDPAIWPRLGKLVLSPSSTELHSLSPEEFSSFQTWSQFKQVAKMLLSSTVYLGWVANAMVFGFSKPQTDGQRLQDTEVFRIFDLFFTAVPLFVGLAAQHYLMTRHQPHLLNPDLSPPILMITTECSADSLLKILRRAHGGMVVIATSRLLSPEAFSELESYISGGFVPEPPKDNRPGMLVPVVVQIIIFDHDAHRFSDVSKKSGRVTFMSGNDVLPQPVRLDAPVLPGIPRREAWIDPFSDYEAILGQEKTAPVPFSGIIGRQSMISTLITQITAYTDALKIWIGNPTSAPPRLGIIICDKQSGLFGSGKTTLMNAIASELKRQLEGVTLPGLFLVRKGTVCEAVVSQTPPSRVPAHLAIRVSESLLLGVIIFLNIIWLSVSAASTSGDSSSKYRLFSFESLTDCAAILLAGLYIVLGNNSDHITQDTRPKTVVPPGKPSQKIDLFSAPRPEDFYGTPTLSASPQFAFAASSNGLQILSDTAIGGIVTCESVVDHSPHDRSATKSTKNMVLTTFQSILCSGEFNMGSTRVPYAGVILVTSNHTPLELSHRLDGNTQGFTLQSLHPLVNPEDTLPRDGKTALVTASELFKEQLVHTNESFGLLKWSNDAMTLLYEKIHFKEILSGTPKDGHVLLLRHYFQDLIKSATAEAISTRKNDVDTDVVDTVWKQFIKAHSAYLTGIFKAIPRVDDRKLTGYFLLIDSVEV